MTGLTTIENDPYVSPISLILTKVDGTYLEFHRQLCHQSRIGFITSEKITNVFNQIV